LFNACGGGGDDSAKKLQLILCESYQRNRTKLTMISDENVAPQIAKAKTAKVSSKGSGKTIEETYQKKSQLEHILLRPDTYIGSIEAQTQPTWVFDSTSGQIVNKTITFVPGLYKIYGKSYISSSHKQVE